MIDLFISKLHDAKFMAMLLASVAAVATVLTLAMPLFTTTTGNIILGVSGLWMSIGIFVMRQMINFEV